MEQKKTWATFQEHFIEVQADLWERQRTSRQGGYHTGTANNATEMSMAFTNLAQATAEYRAAVTNLTTANSTLTEQVALYANRLSTEEAEIMEMQTAMSNPQGEIKNLKAEVASLNKSGHSGGTSAANRDNCRMVPKWKI